MPKILSERGVDVMIYLNDHEPPHCHCFVGDGQVVIIIESLSIRESHNVKAKEEKKALKVVSDNQSLLLSAWDNIHS